jgi:predicted metal-dependent phosphoesterase TrpH
MGISDLHMHTIFSYDGTASVKAVLGRARVIGLDVIAITDHDEIRGALLAEQLAPQYGIQVIPASEVTTGEGDLLALGIRKLIPAGMTLIETLLRVGDQGGYCIIPHLMAGGVGMKSLSYGAVRKASRHPEAGKIILGIETLNATALDRESGVFADLLAHRSKISKVGNSDAHVLDAIGLGVTEFPGRTIADLYRALVEGTTVVKKTASWSTAKIMGVWLADYLRSAPIRLMPAMAQ